MPEQYRFFEKNFLKKDTAVYKKEKRGYNDNSQKIRKYLSSPKEAFRAAESAVLGASAMFKGFKIVLSFLCPTFLETNANFMPLSRQLVT